MKPLKLSSLLFIPLVFLLLSCDREVDTPYKPYNLSFSKTIYNMTTRGDFVPIKSGNGDYEIISSDESTITVTYDPFVGGDFGSIYFNPKKTGKADITVTDKLTAQSVKLGITIHNAYLAFRIAHMGVQVFINDTEHRTAIENDLKNKFSLSGGETYILVGNSSSALYKYLSPKNMPIGDYIKVGNYSLEEQSGQYFLSFELTDHTNKYMIHNESSYTPPYFPFPYFSFFGIEMDSEPRLLSSSFRPKEYLLFENFTDEYKAEYPDLVSARIGYIYQIDYPREVDVPVKLLEE